MPQLGSRRSPRWAPLRLPTPRRPYLTPLAADTLADVLLAGTTVLPEAAPAPAPAVAQWALPTLAPHQRQLYQLPAAAAPAGWPHAGHAPLQQAGGAPRLPLAAAEQAPRWFGAAAPEQGMPPTCQPHLSALPAQAGALHAPGGVPSSGSAAAEVHAGFGDLPASGPAPCPGAELDGLLAGVEPSYEELRVSLKVRTRGFASVLGLFETLITQAAASGAAQGELLLVGRRRWEPCRAGARAGVRLVGLCHAWTAPPPHPRSLISAPPSLPTTPAAVRCAPRAAAFGAAGRAAGSAGPARHPRPGGRALGC